MRKITYDIFSRDMVFYFTRDDRGKSVIDGYH